jgi:hypothetical protein
MEQHGPPIHGAGRARRRSTRVRWLSTAAVLLGSTGILSVLIVNGQFVDSATITGNTFVSGSVNLSLTPATAVVSSSNMNPGNVVTAALTIINSGSLNLRYAVTSTINNTAGSISLAAQLKLRIRSGVTTCDTASFDATGTDAYSSAAAGGGAFGSLAGTSLIGDPATGQQTGDRTLTSVSTAPSNAEVLCVQVALPSGSGNAFQALASTASFRFDAEQTKNNGGS